MARPLCVSFLNNRSTAKLHESWRWNNLGPNRDGSSVTTSGLTPHTLFQSHTQTGLLWEAFTWRRRRPSLWVGCGWRAPPVPSRTHRSSSCTWPGSSWEDAASATTALWESDDCRKKVMHHVHDVCYLKEQFQHYKVRFYGGVTNKHLTCCR